MTGTPPTVGVIPLPEQYNVHEINKLRLRTKSQPARLSQASNPPLPPSSADGADQTCCEKCGYTLNSGSGWLFLDSYICDTCIQKLIERRWV